MEIKIHAQHLHLTDDQKEWIEKKVGHLADLADRIGDESSEIKVDLFHHQSKKTEESYEGRLTLFVPHNTLRAEAHADSMENVIDEVLDKIKPQVEKYKYKEHHMEKRHAS